MCIVSQLLSQASSSTLPQDPASYRLSDGGSATDGQEGAAAPHSEEESPDPQGVHLLTIFPLRNMQDFARLSCIAVTETVTPCSQPFCASRRELTRLLSLFLPEDRVGEILSTLDSKAEVQMTIGDSDARDLGFMAKVM